LSFDDDTFALDFDVAKSIRYHAYRCSFWDAMGNLSKILTIISGSAVLVTIVPDMPLYSKILAIIVALTSAADVLFKKL
jgi:hypothetical protein